MLSVIDLADLKGEKGDTGVNSPDAAGDDAALAAFVRGETGLIEFQLALDQRYGSSTVNIESLGGVGDGKQVSTASITAGSATLSIGSASFSADDVGKAIGIYGAGAAGAVHATTISAFISATSVTLLAAAVTTVSNASAQWGTDNTQPIRDALNSAFPAKTIYCPTTGSGAFYYITDTITVDGTRPSVRFMGNPRDAYAVSIRASKPITMFMIKAPGVVFENLGIVGFGGLITGVEYWGDASGNLDGRIDGCVFQGLYEGVRTRGRNLLVTGETYFTANTYGVIIDGPDAIYHTGTWENRGNAITNCRFEGNGGSAAQGAISATAAAKLVYITISDNRFAGGGRGDHIQITGTAANPALGVVCQNNNHLDLGASAYNFTYVQSGTIDGANIVGHNTATDYFSNDAIKLVNCNTVTVNDIYAQDIGRSGIKAASSTKLRIRDSTFASVGKVTGTPFHGLDIDSTNSLVKINNVSVLSATGYGFSGEAVTTSMTDCQFLNCTLGNIDSMTVQNSTSMGTNTFVEGKFGRMEEVGRKTYDFTAGVAKPVAQVFAGSNFGSMLVELEFMARDPGGNCYVFAKRTIRPESGTPVYVTLGTDVTAAASVAFATLGSSGVTVSITTTGTVFGTVSIRAVAGGAVNGTTPRGVTLNML